jgi:hypothetical protein
MESMRNEYMILPPASGGKILLGRYGVKVKVKFILEQATKAQRRSSGIALIIL